ncbi:MAG: kelch repeat-containing protein [Candidatus Poribacteria bacterium]
MRSSSRNLRDLHARGRRCWGRVAVLALFGACCLGGYAAEWVTRPDMPTPRYRSAGLAIDGRIYVVGGRGEGDVGWLRTTEVYDPVANRWAKRADMPLVDRDLGAAVVAGRNFIVGSEAVLRYKAGADVWELETMLPTPRILHASSAVGGKIYVVGGGFRGDPPILTAEVDEYDTALRVWSKKTPIPTPRWSAATAVVDGKICVIGGSAHGANQVAIVEAYDPQSDTWAVLPPMPTARRYAAATVVDGTIYVVGGVTVGVNELAPLAVVETYNPSTGVWLRAPDMPEPGYGGTAVSSDGAVYVIGGWNQDDEHLATIIALDTGARVVTPQRKLTTTWGDLKR